MTAVLVAVLLLFGALQSFIPLRTAVEIGADEGFELAKATLCLKGYKLYSHVWTDHPPLHTWLITQAIKLQSGGLTLSKDPVAADVSPLHLNSGNSQSRLTSAATVEVSGEQVSGNGDRRDTLPYYSPLGPRLVTVGFAALLLTSVFLMALRLGGLPSAAITTVLLIASPGFLELSSSCMMEIPALAPVVAALCVLLLAPQTKWHPWEILAGVLFGIGLGMKLLGLILLPLAALIVWLRCRLVAQPSRLRVQASPPALLANSLPTSLGALASRRRVSSAEAQLAVETTALPARGFVHFLFPRGMLRSLIIVCVTIAITFVALDWFIERGAFLRHFHQSWAAHFAPAVSFDYGSPSDHRFPPVLLLKNWDVTIPAVVGIVVLLGRAFHKQKPLTPANGDSSPTSLIRLSATFSRFRERRTSDGERAWPTRLAVLLPVAWLALALVIFPAHTPWWSYYYVHLAIPLCWCAAVGLVFVWSAAVRKLKGRGTVTGQRRPAGRAVLLRKVGIAVPLVLFALGAAAWMGMRVYLQIAGIRNSPQTHYALVLKEIARFKPFTEWIYADNLTYSFHAGIPIPPQLAVVSLKRLWSGELTIAQVGDEVRKFKPGVIALRNDSRVLPFQDLLEAEYRLVYHDEENRLYAHRTIANQPDQ